MKITEERDSTPESQGPEQLSVAWHVERLEEAARKESQFVKRGVSHNEQFRRGHAAAMHRAVAGHLRRLQALEVEVAKFRQAAKDEAELIGCCEQCGAGCVPDVDHECVGEDGLTFCDPCYQSMDTPAPETPDGGS